LIISTYLSSLWKSDILCWEKLQLIWHVCLLYETCKWNHFSLVLTICIILICSQQAAVWVRVTVSVIIGAILMSKLDVILYIFCCNCIIFTNVQYRLPEDGLWVRPKHVGELTDNEEVLCKKLVLNICKYQLNVFFSVLFLSVQDDGQINTEHSVDHKMACIGFEMVQES